MIDRKKEYVEDVIIPSIKPAIEALKKAGIPFVFNIGVKDSIMCLRGTGSDDPDFFSFIEMVGNYLDGDSLDFDALVQDMADGWPGRKEKSHFLRAINNITYLGPVEFHEFTHRARVKIDEVPTEEQEEKARKAAESISELSMREINTRHQKGRYRTIKQIDQALVLCNAEEHMVGGLEDDGDQYLYMKAEPSEKFVEDLGLEPCDEGKYNWKLSLQKLLDRSKKLSYFI